MFKVLLDELERGEISEDKSYKVGWLSSTLILFGSVCCIGTFGLELLKIRIFFSRNFQPKRVEKKLNP